MERTYVKDIKASEETTVLVKGWIHRIRDLGHITFVHLRDKTGIIQLIIDKEDVQKLRLEMCVEVIGDKVENEKAPGGIEIQAKEISVIGNIYYDKLPFEINGFKYSRSWKI